MVSQAPGLALGHDFLHPELLRQALTHRSFGSDHNEGVILFADGTRVEIPRMTKREMADRILDLVGPRLPKP